MLSDQRGEEKMNALGNFLFVVSGILIFTCFRKRNLGVKLMLSVGLWLSLLKMTSFFLEQGGDP
jgi:hypothetical protein